MTTGRGSIAGISLLLLALYISLNHQPGAFVAGDDAESQTQNLDQVVWWKKTNFYHIYLRSFKDATGDGNGDLRGVIEKLDYLKEMGVETILMAPFYSSPMKDCGYDIDDYEAILPMFGSVRDFEDLMAELKKRHMRMVVDFVPNHSSDKHRWFYCSERALLPEFEKECAQYKDYYVWSSSRRFNGSYPTNWASVFGGGPAWTWSELRKQFYLHQFLAEQPDLNFTNPKVRDEFKQIARYWLRKGADGLRVDSAIYLIEDTENWTDNPPNPSWKEGDDAYDKQLHIYTRSLPQSAEIMKDWREVAQEPEFAGQQKVIITEAYDDIPKLIEYYGRSPADKFADLPFNFELFKLTKDNLAADYIEEVAMNWIEPTRSLGWPDEEGAMSPWIIWVTGNHDNKRMANRVGTHQVPLLRWITYFLPGVPVNYYGDELPIHDAAYNEIPQKTFDEGEPTRLPFRVPMAWTAGPQGGFSSSPDLWLPLNRDFKHNNVEYLLSNASEPLNQLKLFLQLQELRRRHLGVFVFGDCVFFKNSPADNKNMLAIGRTHPKLGNLMLLANLDPHYDLVVRLRAARSVVRKANVEPPTEGQILMVNHEDLTRAPRVYRQAKVDQLEGLVLARGQAVILNY